MPLKLGLKSYIKHLEVLVSRQLNSTNPYLSTSHLLIPLTFQYMWMIFLSQTTMINLFNMWSFSLTTNLPSKTLEILHTLLVFMSSMNLLECTCHKPSISPIYFTKLICLMSNWFPHLWYLTSPYLTLEVLCSATLNSIEALLVSSNMPPSHVQISSIMLTKFANSRKLLLILNGRLSRESYVT